MSLGIQIEVSPGNALPTISSVEGALGKVEQAGPRAGAAISQGLQQGSAAAERAKASAAGLSQQMQAMSGAAAPFKAIADAMQREADMLQTIRGPMQQYMKDLETLDSMLSKGAISTNEYADQVTKMNARIGEKPTGGNGSEGPEKREGVLGGSLAQAVGGQFGEGGSVLGGLFSGGGLEAAGVVGLGAAVVELSDDYGKLSNQALRLGDSYANVNQAMNAQLGLADDLHSSLDQTLELSIAVKERTDDLNLSTDQQAQLTKALGQVAILSGQNAAGAAQMFDQFTVALQSGMDAGRAMRTIFIQFPELADELERHFGMSARGLVDMANKGKLGVHDMIAALSDTDVANERMEKFGNVTETVGEHLQHFYDSLKNFNWSDDSPVLKWTGITEMENQIKDAQEKLKQTNKIIDELEDKIRQGEALQYARDATLSVSDAMTDLANHTIGAKDALYALVGAYNNWANTAGDGDGILAKESDKLLGLTKQADAYRSAVQKIVDEANSAPQRLGAQRPTYTVDTIGHANLAPADQLIVAQYNQLEKRIKTGDLDEYTKQIKAFGDASEKASHQHQDLIATMTSPEQARAFGAAAFGLSSSMQLPGLAATMQLGAHRPALGFNVSPGLQLNESTDMDKARDDEIKQAQALYEQTRSSAQKYDDEASKISANDQLRDDLKTKALQDLAARYGAVVDPMKKYAEEIDLVNAMQARGALSTTEYAAAMKKIGDEQRDARLQSGQGSIGDAFSSQFEKLAKDGGNAGQVMASTFGSAIGEMNTALESLVTGANVSWSSIGQSFEKMLVDMGLKLAESQIFKWLGGAISGSTPSSGIGTDTGIGAIGAYIGGLFANGGDVTIPHAAFGYAGRVGGSGGTDSKLFAAMVTPGETVSIRTPEQMSASSRGSAPAQVHVIMPDNKRALLKTAASADGQRQVINTIQRNKSALRGLLK